MPTTVVKTIGSAGGRDYSTLQSWEDAAPANLVTADEVWEGDCYNDSEFTAGVVISGSTTDATHFKRLTCGSGQSFQDSALVRTNALTYSVANGVGVKTSSYTPIVDVQEDFAEILRLQLYNQVGVALNVQGAVTSFTATDLITRSDVVGCVVDQPSGVSGSHTLINVLMIHAGSGGDNCAITSYIGTITLIGCCSIRTSNQSPAGVGYKRLGSVSVICESCSSFGYSTASSGLSASSKNNATDQTSFGAGSSNQTSVAYTATTPFTQANATGALDLRPVAGTALAANGFLDATNAPNDISGFTRPANPTIGVWQLASAAVTTGRSYFL